MNVGPDEGNVKITSAQRDILFRGIPLLGTSGKLPGTCVLARWLCKSRHQLWLH